MQKRRVLILCTGNSARSQIAEAIINHDLSDHWEAFSAGTVPSGYVHPLAIRVLEEIGINHKGESKSVNRFRGMDFDVAITVCDDAEENCPVWLGKGKREHIGFPDPVKVIGTEADKVQAFRQVRDNIRLRLLPFLISFQSNEKRKE